MIVKLEWPTGMNEGMKDIDGGWGEFQGDGIQ